MWSNLFLVMLGCIGICAIRRSELDQFGIYSMAIMAHNAKLVSLSFRIGIV